MAEPMKPSSSPTAVKMKSVCCSGTLPSRVWVPLNRPLPIRPPDADRDLGLVDVVGRHPWRRSRSPSRPRTPSAGTAGTGPASRSGAPRRRRRGPGCVSAAMWRACAPPISSIPIPTATKTSTVPRSGCSMISAIGKPSTPSTTARRPKSSSLSKWATTEAKRDDHARSWPSPRAAAGSGRAGTRPVRPSTWCPGPTPRGGAAASSRRRRAGPAPGSGGSRPWRRRPSPAAPTAMKRTCLLTNARVEVRRAGPAGRAEDHQAAEGPDGSHAADQHEVHVAPRRGRVAGHAAQGAGGDPAARREGGGGHQSRTSPGSGERLVRSVTWPPTGAGGRGCEPDRTSNRRRATGAAAEPP